MSGNCDRIRGGLSAWIDGEVDAERSAEIALHLVDCDACRLETEGLREAARGLGEAALEVPAPPRAFAELAAIIDHPPRTAIANRPATRRPRRLLIGVTAALAAGILMVVWPGPAEKARPTTLVEVALARFRALNDARISLEIEIEPPAGFGGEKVVLPIVEKTIHRSGAWLARWFEGRQERLAGGHDDCSWTFDPVRRQVELVIDDQMVTHRPDVETTFLDAFLVDVQTWTGTMALGLGSAGGEPAFDEVESTGETARRIFRLRAGPADGNAGPATLIIDPEGERLVEVILPGTGAAGAQVRLRFRILEVDRGFDPEWFRPERHVPAGTPRRTLRRF